MNISSDELLSALNHRYATKQFDPTFVLDASQRATLEEALRLTPSSFGLQPWKFVFVENPELRKQLRAVSYDQPQITDASALLVLCRYDEFGVADVDRFVRQVAEIRRQPYEGLTAYRQMMEGFVGSMSPEALHFWMEKQVYIALGNLLTSCAMLGLDACPIEGIHRAEYDRILDLPARGARALMVCPIGRRALEDPYAKAPKVRYSVSELFDVL